MVNNSNNAVKITLIIVAAVIILALIAMSLFSRALPVDMKDKLSVEGLANIKASPDVVSLYINIETTADDSSTATSDNSEVVEDIISSLLAKGFSQEDVQTQNFNVNPNYEWNNNYRDRTVNGYKAVHSLRIQSDVANQGMISEAIDVSVDKGALINYINFELSQDKQNDLKAEALKQATEDARNKAEAIAEGLDMSLGNVISVSTSDLDYYPWKAYAMEDSAESGAVVAAAAKEATSIQPGEKEVNARINVVFKLK